jgi:hypothetical protein
MKLPTIINFIDLPRERRVIPHQKGFKAINKVFPSFVEAYDYLSSRENTKAIFDAEKIANHEFEGKSEQLKSMSENMLLIGNRMIVSFSNNDYKDMLLRSYEDFLSDRKSWLKDKNNWVKAYNYIVNHPAFWHRKESGLNSWITDDGMEDIWQTVLVNKKGKPVIILEHGHYETALINDSEVTGIIPTHNIDLDVRAGSYEKAIIKLAKNVERQYTKKGALRIQPAPNEIRITLKA